MKNSAHNAQPFYARNIIIGYARLDGHVIGVVANQPAHLAGTLDIGDERQPYQAKTTKGF